MLRRAVVVVLAAVGAAGLLAPSAAAQAEFQVEIDARGLAARLFSVYPMTGFLDSAVVQTVTLPSGVDHRIWTYSPAADFMFRVDGAGNIDYPAEFEHFLDGDGTNRLTLVGLPVTVDARYLPGLGVLPVQAGNTRDDFISHETVRLLPSTVYYWQQGSGRTVNFRAALRRDGTWWYDARFDGYMAGRGTGTLTFYGYPLIVDARAAGGTGVLVHPVAGLAFDTSGVQTVVLLPADPYHLQVRAGVVAEPDFRLDDNGVFSFDAGAPFALDTFDGLTRLTVTGPI
ncbi:MAG TPA: hypothetical protein VGD67_26140 [Pseudonocardiaceae bacterium]